MLISYKELAVITAASAQVGACAYHGKLKPVGILAVIFLSTLSSYYRQVPMSVVDCFWAASLSSDVSMFDPRWSLLYSSVL